MALPTDLHDLICVALPRFTKSSVIRFPSGVELELVGEDIYHAEEKLLAKLNTALMPLVPLFNVIDVLITVLAVFEAVKSLNPLEIIKAIKKLKPKIDKLLRLIPQLSVPFLILDTIDALLVFLAAFRAELLVLIKYQEKLARAATRAAALGAPPALILATACASENLADMFVNMKARAAPLNRLIALLNLLCGIAGLPELPALDDLGAEASAALAPIDLLIAALGTVRGAIPV